jgi:hypothetical protein
VTSQLAGPSFVPFSHNFSNIVKVAYPYMLLFSNIKEDDIYLTGEGCWMRAKPKEG